MDYKLFDRSQQQQTNSTTRKVLGTTQNRALQEGNFLQKPGEVPSNKIRNDVQKRGARENENNNRLNSYLQNPQAPFVNPDHAQYDHIQPDPYGNLPQGIPQNQDYQEYYYGNSQQDYYQNHQYVQQDKWAYNDYQANTASEPYYGGNKYDNYHGANLPSRYGMGGPNENIHVPTTGYEYSAPQGQYQQNYQGYNYGPEYHPENQNWNNNYQQQYQNPHNMGYGYDQPNQTIQPQMYNPNSAMAAGKHKHAYTGYNQNFQPDQQQQGQYSQMYPMDMGTPIPQQQWRTLRVSDALETQNGQYYSGYNNWAPNKETDQDPGWNIIRPIRNYARNPLGAVQAIIPIVIKEDKGLVSQHLHKQSGFNMIPEMTVFSRSEKSIDINSKLLQNWVKKSLKDGQDHRNLLKYTYTRPRLLRSTSVESRFFQKLPLQKPQKKFQHKQPSYLDPKPPKKTTRSNSFVHMSEFKGKLNLDSVKLSDWECVSKLKFDIDLQRRFPNKPKSKMAMTEKGSAANSASVKQQPSVNQQKSEVPTTAYQPTTNNTTGAEDQRKNLVTPAKKAAQGNQDREAHQPLNLSTPLASPIEPRQDSKPYTGGLIDSSKQFSYQFDSGMLGEISRSLADFDDSRVVNVSKGNDKMVSQASILKNSPVTNEKVQAAKQGRDKPKKEHHIQPEISEPEEKANPTRVFVAPSAQIEQSPPSREQVKELFAKLLQQGLVKIESAVAFDKQDPHSGEVVKYVAFEIVTHKYNDHFISVKPEVLPAKDYEKDKPEIKSDNQKQSGYGQGNRRQILEQGNWNYPQTNPKQTTQKLGTQQAIQNKVLPVAENKKPVVGATVGSPTGGSNWEKKKPEVVVQPTAPPKEAAEAEVQPKTSTVNGKELVQQFEAAEKMVILEQATHKIQTGKLQRWLKKLNDEEKVAVFRQFKHVLPELLIDQYGRYVVVLFLKTTLTAIVDTLISVFDKMMDELIHHKYGVLFCQSLIDVKFKDVRLRRVLKRIDKNLREFVEDETSAQTVLTYVNLLPAADLGDFVEYCKTESKICLGHHTACKIFAKVLSKVSDVERLEIELHLKTIMAQIFETKEGVELIEVFVTKADAQNLQNLLNRVYGKLAHFLKSEDHEYFFAKVAELKNLEIINEVISRIFLAPGCPSDQEIVDLINHEVANRTLLSFFTMTSFDVKDKMRRKLVSLKANPVLTFSQNSKKLLSICENYFGSSSPSAP